MVYILKIEKNMNIYYNNCDNFSKGGCLGMNLKALPAIEGDHNLKTMKKRTGILIGPRRRNISLGMRQGN